MHSLRTKPELNGLKGALGRHYASKGRWEVLIYQWQPMNASSKQSCEELKPTKYAVSIKEANLQRVLDATNAAVPLVQFSKCENLVCGALCDGLHHFSFQRQQW